MPSTGNRPGDGCPVPDRRSSESPTGCLSQPKPTWSQHHFFRLEDLAAKSCCRSPALMKQYDLATVFQETPGCGTPGRCVPFICFSCSCKTRVLTRYRSSELRPRKELAAKSLCLEFITFWTEKKQVSRVCSFQQLLSR